MAAPTAQQQQQQQQKDSRQQQIDTGHFRFMQDELERSANRFQGPEAEGTPDRHAHNASPGSSPEVFPSRLGGWRSTLRVAFAQDMPPGFLCLMKCFLAFYLAYVLMQVLTVGTAASLVKHLPVPEGSITLAVTILFSLALVVAAYLSWYRLLYRALRDRLRSTFVWSQVFLAAQIVVSWVQVLGVPYVFPGFIVLQNLPEVHGDGATAAAAAAAAAAEEAEVERLEDLRTLLMVFGVVHLIHASVGKLLLIVAIVRWRRAMRFTEGR